MSQGRDVVSDTETSRLESDAPQLMSEHAGTIATSDFFQLRPQRFWRLARRILLSLLDADALGASASLKLIERWGKRRDEMVIGEGALRADLTINDRRAYPALVFGGSKGLGRSYVNGLWDTSDLTSLMRLLFRATQPSRRRLDSLARRGDLLRSRIIRHTPTHAQERENIHAHYDLSNEFFAIMLDETMAYSCAIFEDETTSLFDAQVEKFDRICRKLRLGPGDHVIEIGTGWGGFALHAAGQYGARVTTTTISENQRQRAIERVAEAGLDHLITVLGEHYEDLAGTYDALVSIEMIEAVDWRKYDQFFAKCSGLLVPDGRMALQAITISDQSFDRAKYRDDFIRDLIFPGGCLPSLSAVMTSVARATDLRAVGLEDIGLDYALTLSKWRSSVHERFDEVVALGFDDRFARLWDMYLSYCEAAFLERHISDVQLILHKPEASTPRA
jgi:cyclopropane-fatty-acyl-phospholipid synthase